jgi:secreted trypsin-like serine protease
MNSINIFLAEMECGRKILGIQPEFVAGSCHDPENPVGEWPWMASLGFYKDEKWQHQCGATLISHQHFLTAGHCLREVNKR